MRINIKWFCYVFCLITSYGKGQDGHFTQFEKALTVVNPAYVGNFEGTLRLSGIYRDQYRGLGTGYSSYNLSGEYNIPFAFRKQDWIAGGIQMYNDKAGSLGQKMSYYSLNLAYHLAFSEKQNRILTLGAQYGTGSIDYDLNRAESAEKFLGNTSPNVTSISQNESFGSTSDLVIGVLFTSKGERSIFNIGGGVEGILGADRGVISVDEKPMGFNVSTLFTQGLSETKSWTASAWYYHLGAANALNLQGKYNMKINQEQDLWLSLGVGTRSFNSLMFIVGFQIKDIDVGLAYDHTISSLANGSGYGALELGVTYIYKHYKRPQPKPLIYCPRL